MSKLINLYHLKVNNVKPLFFLLLLFNLYNVNLLSQTNSTNIKTIVIDPGHGGKDPGHLSKTKGLLTEKELNLLISKK